MKRKSGYTGIWLLLALALIFFLIISFMDEINIGDWTVRKATFSDQLLKDPNAIEPLSGQALTDSLNAAAANIESKVDSTPQSILLIGDSMTFNLALQLAKYAKASGHTFHAVNWDSSNTKIWAESDTLTHYIKEYDVSFVFISLGANELYLAKPEGHRKYVEAILSKVGDRPYIWIGPPNWKEDAGLNDMIQSACKPGAFFRSAGMEFKRKKDGVHPTRESSAEWMDSIMRWLPESAHPFVVNELPDSIGKVNPDIVLLKPKR